VSAQGDNLYDQPRWMDFTVAYRDGSAGKIRALGLALDGDDLLFFNHWAQQSPPAGTRVPRANVISITTDAAPRAAREG
jgi:hypothetical protein